MIKNIIGIILLLIGIGGTLYIRFTNIDMAETRLLVEYWPQWLFIALLLIIGTVIFLTEGKR